MHLFRFGYQTPRQQRIPNGQFGWDHENSRAFFIVCEDTQRAYEWGKHIAIKYLEVMYGNGNVTRDMVYGWMETDEDEIVQMREQGTIPVIPYGEMPDVEQMARERYGDGKEAYQ